MSNIDQLDKFEIPDNLTDADAEYIRIKLARCVNNAEADKCRIQLKLIEERLLIAHNEKLRIKNVKKSI